MKCAMTYGDNVELERARILVQGLSEVKQEARGLHPDGMCVIDPAAGPN
jgi:hypothetical protein